MFKILYLKGKQVQDLYLKRKVQELKPYSSVRKMACEKSRGETTFSPFPFLLLILFLGDSNMIPLPSETSSKSPKSPSGFSLSAAVIFKTAT
eukprot:snap_masked-scaffold_9-processed-gene-10.14-mRNA-1 protein AED:1.00 eAED:1.00 QI:0/-1/0/0/-1/1/1/0/91